MSSTNEGLTPDDLQKALQFIQTRVDFPVQVGMVLGSGLGKLADKVSNPVIIPYSDIPGFPVSTVSGHKGRFVFGSLNNGTVAVMQGRFHLYEGVHPSKAVIGIRLFAALGIRNLVLTNAAGGLNNSFTPGDLMLLDDHLNLLGANPLTGPHFDDWGARFVDCSEVYSKVLAGYGLKTAKENNFKLHQGVYAALPGPSYETPAEVRMLRTLGADAAGMSTVPEAIVARQSDIRTMGISLITNMGAGIVDEEVNHEDVMNVAEGSYPQFEKLVEGVLAQIDAE